MGRGRERQGGKEREREIIIYPAAKITFKNQFHERKFHLSAMIKNEIRLRRKLNGSYVM